MRANSPLRKKGIKGKRPIRAKYPLAKTRRNSRQHKAILLPYGHVERKRGWEQRRVSKQRKSARYAIFGYIWLYRGRKIHAVFSAFESIFLVTFSIHLWGCSLFRGTSGRASPRNEKARCTLPKFGSLHSKGTFITLSTFLVAATASAKGRSGQAPSITCGTTQRLGSYTRSRNKFG